MDPTSIPTEWQPGNAGVPTIRFASTIDYNAPSEGRGATWIFLLSEMISIWIASSSTWLSNPMPRFISPLDAECVRGNRGLWGYKRGFALTALKVNRFVGKLLHLLSTMFQNFSIIGEHVIL